MAITLNSVVYNWSGFDQSGVSRWTATASGVASAFSNLTARVTVSTSSGKNQSQSKVKWRIQIPVIATEDSACGCVGSVLRTSYVDIAADFGATSTLVERQDALARLRTLVLTDEFSAGFTALSQAAG